MIKGMVHSIDAWLWRLGMHNPQIRAVVRTQLLFVGITLLGGGLLAPLTHWPLWFAVGAAIFANVFWGLARHFLRVTLTAYSSGLLLGLLLRSGLRLLITAGILYVALIVCAAPAAAVVCGMTAGTAVALGTYALGSLAGHN